MKTYSKNTEDTLVTFHIGRGGRYYNAGHLTYLGQDQSIQHYTDDLFLGYENEAQIVDKVRSVFEENNEGEYFDNSELLDCFTDRNIQKLKNVFGIEESELGLYGHKDHNGRWLDLPHDAITGVINIDYDYNTTYVKYLKDCSEGEFEKILTSTSYVSDDVMQYCKESLGIEEDVENEYK